jgi:hypothetical protein
MFVAELICVIRNNINSISFNIEAIVKIFFGTYVLEELLFFILLKPDKSSIS